MDFVERQTMGPAACTVDGEKVHTNLLEESWWPPFSGLAAPWEGSDFLYFFLWPPFFFLPLFLLFPFFPPSLPSFLPVGIFLGGLWPNISGGFRDHDLQPSLLNSPCHARSKVLFGSCRLQTRTDSPWVLPAGLALDRARPLPQNLSFYFVSADTGTESSLCSRGLCSSLDSERPCQCPLGIWSSLLQEYPFSSLPPSLLFPDFVFNYFWQSSIMVKCIDPGDRTLVLPHTSWATCVHWRLPCAWMLWVPVEEGKAALSSLYCLGQQALLNSLYLFGTSRVCCCAMYQGFRVLVAREQRLGQRICWHSMQEGIICPNIDI